MKAVSTRCLCVFLVIWAPLPRRPLRALAADNRHCVTLILNSLHMVFKGSFVHTGDNS